MGLDSPEPDRHRTVGKLLAAYKCIGELDEPFIQFDTTRA